MRRLLVSVVTVGILLFPTALFASDGSHDHGEAQWWLLAMFLLQCLFIAVLAQKRYLVESAGEIVPAFSELRQLAAFLLSGTVIAQLWVHGDPEGYAATMHALISSVQTWFGAVEISNHFVVNDIFMAVFFGIAAKELVEAMLNKDGALYKSKGLLPMIACLGGVIGPALVFKAICSEEQAGAWAVPCATDIAFAWLGARAIWGAKHPAVIFLLALAIADDFIGMGIIAIFYPQRPFDFVGLLVVAGGMAMAYGFRMYAIKKWAIYLLPAAICWIGLLEAGLHAALALVFVVPFMPMSKDGHDEGLFEEEHEHDTLNAFEHSMKPIVDVGLFFFGLCNAGVAWWPTSAAAVAWDRDATAVFLGLGIGKVVGISLFTLVGFIVLKSMGLIHRLPENKETKQRMQWRDIPLVGVLGAMGFTVALFVATASGGHPSLKLGALASFAYLGIGVLLGKLFAQPDQSVVSSPTQEPELAESMS